MDNMPPKIEKEVISELALIEKAPHLFEPLGIESINENNESVIENDLIKITSKYKEIVFDTFPVPRSEGDFIETSLTHKEKELIKFLEFRPELYYQLEKYQIENKSDGSILDIIKEIENNNIYIRKNCTDSTESGAHSIEPLIKMDIEPKSAAGILIMLHEIGHRKDPSMNNNTIFTQNNSKEEKPSDNKIITKERYAWAYSLNKLRPYIKGFNMKEDDIDILIHKFALGNYSATINKNIIEDEVDKLIKKMLQLLSKQSNY